MSCQQDPALQRAKVSKADRARVFAMFGGRCAYCGRELGSRWHADHVEPVGRMWWRKDGGLERPERHRIDNLMPACPPCNIDKHCMSLDQWRRKLQDSCGVLTRNQSTYRFAVAFGLVQETGAKVVFHFEQVAPVTPPAYVERVITDPQPWGGRQTGRQSGQDVLEPSDSRRTEHP